MRIIRIVQPKIKNIFFWKISHFRFPPLESAEFSLRSADGFLNIQNNYFIISNSHNLGFMCRKIKMPKIEFQKLDGGGGRGR